MSVAAPLGLALAVLPAVTGSVPGSPAGTAKADDATVQLNNMRTGWDDAETAMGPAAVPKFVQRFTTAVNGPVWAQPLVVSRLAAIRRVVSFGNIPVGERATGYVRVSNAGNQVSTVAGTSALPSPFAAPRGPALGLPLIPETDMAIPVTFTPHTKGPFTARYRLTWTDPTGSHTLTVTLTGTGT